MDLPFGSLNNSYGNTGLVVFVDSLSVMAHLNAGTDIIEGNGTEKLLSIKCFDNTICLWKSS